MEVTEQNQIRFQTTMFAGAKPYLILHVVLGIALMMFIIDPRSPWAVGERWIGSFLLWHMIINWSGIMESKNWVLNSEIVRLITTCAVLVYFSDQSPIQPLNLLLVLMAAISGVWVFRFFRSDFQREVINS